MLSPPLVVVAVARPVVEAEPLVKVPLLVPLLCTFSSVNKPVPLLSPPEPVALMGLLLLLLSEALRTFTI